MSDNASMPIRRPSWRSDMTYLGDCIIDDLTDLKRFVWNKGFLLWWYRLYIRKDVFHHSLDLDVDAMLAMSDKQRKSYMLDICKRRQKAHERSL